MVTTILGGMGMVSGAVVRACVAGLAATFLWATAQAAPSTKIGAAPLVSPAAADGYFGSATTATNGTGASGRAKEVVELARALKGDPDLIYEHVRNNMAISWTYGLSKGAVGVIVDRSGTAFDQAQLMIELLRQSGYTADYKLGTITLSGAQFEAWSGITSAKAACQLLSSGGIPAIVNGSTTADCSYGAATVSSVTLSHAWVSVVISGVSYLYDPAYKDHTFKAGVDLATATGLSAGMAMGQTATTSTLSGVPSLTSYNATGLNTALATAATALETYIDANVASGGVADVVGGRSINAQTIPPGGLRQVSLPYTTNVLRTITGAMPDQYRAKLTISLTKARPSAGPDTIVSNRVVYGDEVYGRRLTFEPNFDTSGASFTAALKLTGDLGEALTLASFSNSDNPSFSRGAITLALNLPYAANSGGYMDATVVRNVGYALPFTIVTGFGDTGRGLIDKWGQRRDTPLPSPPDAACPVCQVTYKAWKGDGRRETIAAAWLAQAARAGQLHAAIGKGVFAQHYALGVSAADTVVHQTPNGSYWITDSFDRVDAESGLSFTSVTADAASRRGAVFATVSTIAALKGSVPAQVADLPDVGSVASRFAWGNAPPAAEDPYAPGARAFLEYSNTTQAGQAFALSRTEGFDTAPTTGIDYPDRMPIGPAETTARRQAVADAVSAYVADGFTVVASREGFLGPGQRAGGLIPEAGGKVSHGLSPQRGGALVAIKYDAGGDPIEVADLLVNPNGYADAGGGGAQIYHQAQYDPATSADVVKGRLERGAVGAVLVASPAATSVGQGAFPFSLSANLTWRGSTPRDQTFETGAHREPQGGWITPFTNTLTVSSSGLEAMGETDVRAATGTIAAFFAAQDAYRSSPGLKREVAGQVITAWWLKTLAQNVAMAAVGNETRQWIRKPGGTWLTPGAATYGTLTQTGAASVSAWHPQNSPTCPGINTVYAQTRGYWMRDVSFKVTNGSGDEQTFAHWVNPIAEAGSPPKCAEQHGFRLTTWAWPGGASLTFTYERVGGDQTKIEVLSSVGNNLGLWVNFTDGGLSGLSVRKGLYGSAMMPVTVTQSGAQVTHTDAGGAATKFEMATLGTGDFAKTVVDKIYAADDAGAAATQYVYDALGRVAQIKDRLVLAGSRAPTQYFLADGLRSEILNAAGYSGTIYADAQGRPLRTIGGAGAVSTVAYDGRGRPTLTTSPDGDRMSLEYNLRNLVTKTTRLARAGSAEAGQTLVTEAAWHATYNHPIWTKDARGAQTDYTLGGGVVTKVELPPATTGATRLQANQYFYGSGLPMSWVSPTGFTRSATYSEGGIWDTLTNVISYGTLQGDEPDVSGNPGRLRRPRGGMQKIVYDAVRRPTLITEPQATPGTYCSHEYNPGHCQSTPDPVHWDWSLPAGVSRAARRLTYDPVGRVTKVERGTYVGTAFTPFETYTSEYDAVGNRIKQVGPANVVQISYDALNRPVCTAIRMNPAVYDALPADACQPSASGRFGSDRISRVNYDAAGRVVSEEGGVGSPLQQVTARYAFSSGGQRLSLTDASGNTSGFEYDGFGRLKRLRYPAAPRGSGQISTTDYEEYGYDPNGNRTSWRKRSGTTITYAYDALNRATSIDLPGTADDVYYTYVDADRKVEGRVGSSTATSFTYQKLDEAGRLVEDTLVNPHPYASSIAGTVTYDVEGNRTANATFDLANRLQAVQWRRNMYTPILTIASATYDPLSRLARIDRENGVATTYTYDGASRLVSLSHASAENPTDGSHQTFAYNPAGQLIGQQQVSDSSVWSGQPTTTLNTTHDQLNRDAAIAAVSGYDADGNLLSDGTRTFTYDALNRLRSVTGGPSAVTLTYDAWGRLASTTANGATTSFRYFGPTLVEENDYGLPGAEKRIRAYLLGPNDEPLAAMDAAFTHPQYWFHQDRLGSVIATSDHGGRMTPLTYGPYGEPQSWSGSRFRYTGQMAIPEAQLYHYRARAFDPVLGRFLQTDPIGYDDGPNIYAYVKGDPVNATDPSGTEDSTLPLEVFGGSALGSWPVFVTGGQLPVALEPQFVLPDSFEIAGLDTKAIAKSACAAATNALRDNIKYVGSYQLENRWDDIAKLEYDLSRYTVAAEVEDYLSKWGEVTSLFSGGSAAALNLGKRAATALGLGVFTASEFLDKFANSQNKADATSARLNQLKYCEGKGMG